MCLRGLSLLLILTALLAAAQSPSPWQGEWGVFSGDHAQQGRRLSIHDCTATDCKFSIDSRSTAGSSGTSGDQALTLQSPTTATATLPGSIGKTPCVLHFERQTSAKPAITVVATGNTCTSYYASIDHPSTMSGTYPLRSTTIYAGPSPEECFLDNSPARLAACTQPTVAALEQKWQDLADNYPLQPPASNDESGYKHEQQMDAAILHACDPDRNPATCLTTRYSADIAAMQAKQDAYLAGTVRRGDPAEGGRLAQKIAGRYRERIPNGDVQGHEYTTTDTLTIKPVGAASIHFDAELTFYNGHTCSLAGGALFRKDGSFVFDDAPANQDSPDAPACRLAIIPTPTGVDFNDITGGCKRYCGARGSWNGGFKFKNRVAAPAQPNSSKRPKP